MHAERPGFGALGSRDIAQLLAVADHGSIRRAAESLGMTQPGLSKNIRQIEERLGITVFDRSTSGAVPTDLGTLLLRRGRQILLDLEAIHRDLRDELLSETGRVRLGVGPVVAPLISRQVVAPFHAAHPGISIELDIGTPAALMPRLVRGDFDLFIGSCDALEVPPTVSLQLLAEMAPAFCARAGHPLAGQRDLPLSAVAPYRLARVRSHAQFDGWFRENVGVPIDTGFQCDDFEVLADAVETSDMLTFTAAPVLALLRRRHDLVELDIRGLNYRHAVHCAQPAARPLSRPAQMLVAHVRKVLAG